MQQATSKQLYTYWDRVRDGRLAPKRFEIEPARIASLLPETFIAECVSSQSCRFRLAGTRICEQFGRELRGVDFLSLWNEVDRTALKPLLQTVFRDGAVGEIIFHALTEEGRSARFELLLMPLVHHDAISRVLGAISAIDPPFWLGTAPLVRFEIISLNLLWPDGAPPLLGSMAAPAAEQSNVVRLRRPHFRVFEGTAPPKKD